MKYEPVIGLEVHAHLLTQSKMFCGCSTQFGAEPNTQTCPVCLGMPGVLPVTNKKAIEFAAKMALAVHCEVRERSIFARKNYFYPDLPKGYQISQYEEPFSENGWVEIEPEPGTRKRIRILRIHLEEDAGKSIHDETFVNENESLMDFNRCGVPLIEIVSQPDMRSPQEAYLYLTQLRQLLRWLEICDGNMEEGSLRCDANISIRPAGEEKLGVKTELKNMNSFRGVEKALTFEIQRQMEIINQGGRIQQQTLLWDEAQEIVAPMRGKEEAHDYRYFPDPDLVPIVVEKSWIEAIRKNLPELPEARRKRLIQTYGLPEYDGSVLTEDRRLANYFEETAKRVDDPKQASNWIMGEVLRVLKESSAGIGELKAGPEELAEIIQLVGKGTISHSAGKRVFGEVVNSGESPKKVIEKLGLVQVSDSDALGSIVDEVLRENSAEVDKYKAGKKNLFGFFMGEAMKKSGGKANPKVVSTLLREKLENSAN